MARIELRFHIAAPPERCFDLARSVELHTRSTSSTGERVIAGRTSGLLELNDEATWEARQTDVVTFKAQRRVHNPFFALSTNASFLHCQVRNECGHNIQEIVG